MCRVDLEIVGEENVIDLSTDAAQHVVGTVYLCGTGTVGTVGTIYLCTTGTVGTVFPYGSQPSEQHGSTRQLDIWIAAFHFPTTASVIESLHVVVWWSSISDVQRF